MKRIEKNAVAGSLVGFAADYAKAGRKAGTYTSDGGGDGLVWTLQSGN